MKSFIIKFKSLILYTFFGGCTTLVNIIIYFLATRILNLNTIISTIMAWIFAVLFAYVTNRIWVFESIVHDRKGIIYELISFISCRLLTGLMDLAIMYIFVDILYMNDLIIKIISNLLVIIINYLASKIIIFKKE